MYEEIKARKYIQTDDEIFAEKNLVQHSIDTIIQTIPAANDNILQQRA